MTYFEKLLAEAKEESKKYIQDETFRNNPVVASCREVYQQFKKKKVHVHQLSNVKTG